MVAMVAIDDRTRIASSQGSRVDIHVPPRPSAWNLCAPWLATAGRDHTARQYPFACNDAHAASEEHASYRDAHEHSDRTTGTRSQERCRRARACCCLQGGKNKCGAMLRNVDELCGVLVIVGSHHGLCSRTGTARPAPRARARRAWVRGVECGTTAHRGELQGCKDRSRES